MSGKIMGQVWDLDLPHAHMLVLLALADHADHQGDNVYPGVGLVAWKCGYSLRQTQRIMDDLVARKLLIEVENDPGKRTVYRINLAAGELKAPYKGRQNVTRVKKSPVTFSPPGGDILADHGVTFCENAKVANGASPRAKQPRSPRTNRHVEPSIEPPPPPNPPNGGGGGDLNLNQKPTKTELYHWLRANGVDSPEAAERNQYHDPAATKAFHRRIVGDANGDERKRRIGRFIKALDADGPPPLAPPAEYAIPPPPARLSEQALPPAERAARMRELMQQSREKEQL
jgi:hypothetical protein